MTTVDITMEVEAKDNLESPGENIAYAKEKILTLKHRKDVCSTKIASKRSESVRDMSLDDVIAERKILAPKKKDTNQNHEREFVDLDRPKSEDINLGLNDIIKKRAVSKSNEQELGKSLDEIIKQRNGASGKKEKDGPKDGEESKGFETNSEGGIRKRKLAIDEDEDEVYYASPTDVIHRLSQEGLVIEQEIGKLKDTAQGREHTWRATFSCGEVKVVADSCRKILAKEAAAYEFLKHLQGSHVVLKLPLPLFKIPEACFYDAVVCDRLEEVTVNMGLGIPRFETVQTMKRHREYYTTTYFIGEDEFIGCAYCSMDHSKILAAKSAYETYSGKKFPRDTFIVGQGPSLGGIEPDEFKCIETEATHILTLDSVPTLQDFVSPEEAEDEEVLVDNEGGIFVRASDGSNKIRRLTRASLNDMLEYKLLQAQAEGGGIGKTAKGIDDLEIDSDEEEELM